MVRDGIITKAVFEQRSKDSELLIEEGMGPEREYSQAHR